MTWYAGVIYPIDLVASPLRADVTAEIEDAPNLNLVCPANGSHIHFDVAQAQGALEWSALACLTQMTEITGETKRRLPYPAGARH